MCPWIFHQVQSFHGFRFFFLNERNNKCFYRKSIVASGLAAKLWNALISMISKPLARRTIRKTKIWKISMSHKAAWRSAAEQCQTRMKNIFNSDEAYSSEKKSKWKQSTVNRVILYDFVVWGTNRTTNSFSPRALSLTPLFLWFLLCLRFCHSLSAISFIRFHLIAPLCSIEEWLVRHRVSIHGLTSLRRMRAVSIWEISWKSHKTFNNRSLNFRNKMPFSVLYCQPANAFISTRAPIWMRQKILCLLAFTRPIYLLGTYVLWISSSILFTYKWTAFADEMASKESNSNWWFIFHGKCCVNIRKIFKREKWNENDVWHFIKFVWILILIALNRHHNSIEKLFAI